MMQSPSPEDGQEPPQSDLSGAPAVDGPQCMICLCAEILNAVGANGTEWSQCDEHRWPPKQPRRRRRRT